MTGLSHGTSKSILIHLLHMCSASLTRNTALFARPWTCACMVAESAALRHRPERSSHKSSLTDPGHMILPPMHEEIKPRGHHTLPQ